MKASWLKRGARAAVVVMTLGLTLSARAEEAPDAVVRGTAEAVLARLQADAGKYRGNDAAVETLVRELVFPRFDMERTAQWVLGQNWRKASADQQQRFTAAFATLLLRTYGAALKQYEGQQVRYLPGGGVQGQVASVRTQIVRPDGPPIAVDYKLTNRSGAWKVYDVSIENVSLVVTYRAEYAGIIQREGMDGLIQRLESRQAAS